jgi:hypothetical protein
MKALLCWTLAGLAVLGGVSRMQSTEKKDASPGTARDKLIGAWRLVSLEVPGGGRKSEPYHRSEGHAALHT